MKRVKYKYKLAAGGNLSTPATGAGVAIAGTAGAIGGNILQNQAQKNDGSVRTNDYQWGSAATDAGKYATLGGTLGSIAGPIGTAIGAGVGLLGGGIYGFLHGKKEAGKINSNIQAQQAEQAAQQAEIDKQNADYKTQQQDMYNKSFYTANTEFNNPTGSIYATGGLLKYGNGGSIKKTTQQWDTENTSLGHLPTGFGKQYKEYYDPSKYFRDDNGSFVKVEDKGKTVNYNGDTSYNPFIRYENPQDIQAAVSKKPLSTVIDPMKQVGFNGMQPPLVEQYNNGGDLRNNIGYNSKGGVLNSLASNTVQAEGQTHEQGGITLSNQGNPYAEVEDQEVINGNKVYSDRLTLGNKTYADIAESLGKKKGKYEKLNNSTDYRSRNTAERGSQNIQKKLDNLFEIQEASKIPVNNSPRYDEGGYIPPVKNTIDSMPEEEPIYTGKSNGTNSPNPSSSNGSSFNWNNVIKGAQYAVPFIDNIYNASLINKTPQIPKPNTREAISSVATPMRTNYNVDNQINQVDNAYSAYNKNIDANTSSSSIGRSNKLAAFADTINSKNNIYTNKENMQNQMINANNQNIQNVTNQNNYNKQNIDNQNYALLDNYNMQNTLRSDNILRNKASNVANAVGDADKMIQDSNMKGTDQQRILTDALRYSDGAGVARLVGSNTMNNLVNDPNSYKQIESMLQNQPDKLQQFYKLYGKR